MFSIPILLLLAFGPGGFALTNSGGSELIALDSLASPERIRVALCGDGTAFPVRYARHQTPKPTDTGRQVAANFDNMGGDVFRVTSGRPSGDQTCYLAPDSELVATQLSVRAAASSACSPSVRQDLAAIKQRSLLNCWPMASVQPSIQVVAAEFAHVDRSALASIVLVTNSGLLFQDFPATYSGPEGDTWRADDGGVFSPEGFSVLFLCQVRGVYVMALTWAASEGENAYLLVADSADAFRTVSHAYRYWVPQ
jgi:hypothetical protein